MSGRSFRAQWLQIDNSALEDPVLAKMIPLVALNGLQLVTFAASSSSSRNSLSQNSVLQITLLVATECIHQHAESPEIGQQMVYFFTEQVDRALSTNDAPGLKALWSDYVGNEPPVHDAREKDAYFEDRLQRSAPGNRTRMHEQREAYYDARYDSNSAMLARIWDAAKFLFFLSAHAQRRQLLCCSLNALLESVRSTFSPLLNFIAITVSPLFFGPEIDLEQHMRLVTQFPTLLHFDADGEGSAALGSFPSSGPVVFVNQLMQQFPQLKGCSVSALLSWAAPTVLQELQARLFYFMYLCVWLSQDLADSRRSALALRIGEKHSDAVASMVTHFESLGTLFSRLWHGSGLSRDPATLWQLQKLLRSMRTALPLVLDVNRVHIQVNEQAVEKYKRNRTFAEERARTLSVSTRVDYVAMARAKGMDLQTFMAWDVGERIKELQRMNWTLMQAVKTFDERALATVERYIQETTLPGSTSEAWHRKQIEMLLEDVDAENAATRPRKKGQSSHGPGMKSKVADTEFDASTLETLSVTDSTFADDQDDRSDVLQVSTSSSSLEARFEFALDEWSRGLLDGLIEHIPPTSTPTADAAQMRLRLRGRVQECAVHLWLVVHDLRHVRAALSSGSLKHTSHAVSLGISNAVADVHVALEQYFSAHLLAVSGTSPTEHNLLALYLECGRHGLFVDAPVDLEILARKYQLALFWARYVHRCKSLYSNQAEVGVTSRNGQISQVQDTPLVLEWLLELAEPSFDASFCNHMLESLQTDVEALASCVGFHFLSQHYASLLETAPTTANGTLAVSQQNLSALRGAMKRTADVLVELNVHTKLIGKKRKGSTVSLDEMLLHDFLSDASVWARKLFAGLELLVEDGHFAFWHVRNVLVVDKIAEQLYNVEFYVSKGTDVRAFRHDLSLMQEALGDVVGSVERRLTQCNLGIFHHYIAHVKGSSNSAAAEKPHASSGNTTLAVSYARLLAESRVRAAGFVPHGKHVADAAAQSSAVIRAFADALDAIPVLLHRIEASVEKARKLATLSDALPDANHVVAM